MRIWCYEILTVEKPVAGGLSSVFKCSWKMLFFKNGDTEIFKADRNKLLASNKRLIDNYTLVLHMLHSYMPVVCTHHCRGVFKKIFFVWLLFFVDIWSQKGYLTFQLLWVTKTEFLLTISLQYHADKWCK